MHEGTLLVQTHSRALLTRRQGMADAGPKRELASATRVEVSTASPRMLEISASATSDRIPLGSPS